MGVFKCRLKEKEAIISESDYEDGDTYSRARGSSRAGFSIFAGQTLRRGDRWISQVKPQQKVTRLAGQTFESDS